MTFGAGVVGAQAAGAAELVDPAPYAVGSLIATGGAAPLGTWVDFDLTSAVAGNDTYSFVLKDGSDNAVWYSSEEGTNDPQLVVTFGP